MLMTLVALEVNAATFPNYQKKADSCKGCSSACDFGVVRCSKDLGRYGEREYNCICQGGQIAIP